MDVHLPEYELRLNRSVCLARALPLIVALLGTVSAGLHALGAPLPGMLFGAALSAVGVAHAVILMPGSTLRRVHGPSTRPDTGPVEGLAQT